MVQLTTAITPCNQYPLAGTSRNARRGFWEVLGDMSTVGQAAPVFDLRQKAGSGGAYWDNVNLETRRRTPPDTSALPAFPLSYRNVAARFQ